MAYPTTLAAVLSLHVALAHENVTLPNMKYNVESLVNVNKAVLKWASMAPTFLALAMTPLISASVPK